MENMGLIFKMTRGRNIHCTQWMYLFQPAMKNFQRGSRHIRLTNFHKEEPFRDGSRSILKLEFKIRFVFVL